MASGRIKLDDRDIRILAILQDEGRIPKATLAERVNLSPTPCWERLNRLEESGIIEGYGAVIAERAYGPLTTLQVMIELDSHRAEDARAFEDAIADVPEIVECWSISGGYDYLCRFVTRDLASYQAVIDRLLANGAGVKRYYTYPAIRAVKKTPIPLTMIEDTVR